MFIIISQTDQLSAGSRLKRKEAEEYFELGEYSQDESAYFIFPEGYSGSFSKTDNIAFGATADHLMESYLIESTDVGFYDEGKAS
jgi:hypothetical protein